MVAPPNISTRIRAATADDAPTLWSIRTDAIRLGCREFYSADQVAAWASVSMPRGFVEATSKCVFLVGEEEVGRVVGFAFMAPETSTIEGVFVEPSLHRRGVGRTLLRELHRRAREVGLSGLRLSATLNAEQFYAASGYHVVERTTWLHPNGFELASVSMETALVTQFG